MRRMDEELCVSRSLKVVLTWLVVSAAAFIWLCSPHPKRETKDERREESFRLSSFFFRLLESQAFAQAGGGAQATPYKLTVNVRKTQNQDSPLQLVVQGNAGNQQRYLGRTFYPPNVQDPASESESEVVPVKGVFTQRFDVPMRFANGTFEVALWNKRVEQDQCKVEGGCEVCQEMGFHLEEQLAYKWGYLNDAVVGWFYPTLVRPGTQRGSLVLVVSGEVRNGKAWLGSSLYPKGVKDPVKGGQHKLREVEEGEFRIDLQVDAKFSGGTFELALWQTKQLEVQLAYQSGYLVPPPVVDFVAKVEPGSAKRAPRLVVSGLLTLKNAWLGVSIYPKGVFDATNQLVSNQLKQIKAGRFSEPFSIQRRYADGWFEAAVWGKATKDQTSPTGYRVENLLAYFSGTIASSFMPTGEQE